MQLFTLSLCQVVKLATAIAGCKEKLEDKRDSLRDKSDMLDALTADISDITSAIKGISPATNATPLSDLASVEENQKYQEDLAPRISSLEDKLEKLRAVHDRIAQDCSPADARKLEAKITDLKQKCREKDEKKNEKLEELQKTKEELCKFDDAALKLATWLENHINQLKSQDPPSSSTDVLKEQLDVHNHFTDDVQDEGKDIFRELLKTAHRLKNDMLHNDKVPLNDKVSHLNRSKSKVGSSTTPIAL